jgi:hypothetical protein
MRPRSIRFAIGSVLLAGLAVLGVSSGLLMYNRFADGIDKETVAAVSRENALAMAYFDKIYPGAWALGPEGPRASTRAEP